MHLGRTQKKLRVKHVRHGPRPDHRVTQRPGTKSATLGLRDNQKNLRIPARTHLPDLPPNARFFLLPPHLSKLQGTPITLVKPDRHPNSDPFGGRYPHPPAKRRIFHLKSQWLHWTTIQHGATEQSPSQPRTHHRIRLHCPHEPPLLRLWQK